MFKVKIIPSMQCEHCGECCGVVLCTESEYQRIRRYLAKHQMTPVDNGISCPILLDGRCMAYDVRPTICRLFGHLPSLPCPKGHNVDISERDGQRMLRSAGATTHTLHELAGYTQEALLDLVSKHIEWRAFRNPAIFTIRIPSV